MISTQPFTQQYVEPPESGAAERLSRGLLSHGRLDRPGARAEPATILAWTSVIAALAVGHRFRRSRKPMPI